MLETSLALTFHILGAVVWVGGMFAAYVCLRPAAGALETPQRLALWRRFFAKFFPWVWVSVLLLLLSGYYHAADHVRRLSRRAALHPHNAGDRLADDRAVRLAVPRAVAEIQTRGRRAGLAGRRQPNSTTSVRSS